MADKSMNPFNPVEIWMDTMVKVKEGEDEKMVDAKHYHVRYIVGESEDKRFVDEGGKDIGQMHEKTVFTAPSIHKIPGETFHYNVSDVQRVTGENNLDGKVKRLTRAGQCHEHPLVEVSFQSSGIDCCAMTMEEADEQQVPVQYLSGYLLGRSNGLMKVAMTKTVLESGQEYYESVHIIPEAIVKDWMCLEQAA